MTFDEALNGSGFTIMAKQRLRVVQRDLFEQLDAISIRSVETICQQEGMSNDSSRRPRLETDNRGSRSASRNAA